MAADLERRLLRAIEHEGAPSSDYDLNHDVQLTEGRRLREAGVLVGIMERSGRARIVLTKRSSSLRHHPGQIAFPGGKVDAGDGDAIGAALREAEEEIGLDRGAAQVLGTLPSHETVTGFTVTPVIAMIPDGFVPTPEAGEVEEVFSVPLDHVLDVRRYSVQSRLWRGGPRYYYTVPFGPYYIWGATARMLRALADRMDDGTDR